MTLTIGNGPFAKPAQGSLNFDLDAAAPAHVLYIHDTPKRIRGELGGEVVVDTRRGKVLHETRILPQWYLPLDDVRMDLLEPTEHTTHCPFKGDASYYTVRVGNRMAENAVWTYPEPAPGAPPLVGLGAFYFEAMDRWFEEDEEITGHPRDPFHRVDTRRSSTHIEVKVGDEVVATSDRPVGLFESGLPVRWYLPPDDVRRDLLVPSDTTTYCPYKGVASYWTVRTNGTEVADAAWSYPEPLGEALDVRDHLCFLGDGVLVTVDGAPE